MKEKFVEFYNLKQGKSFLNACKGHQFECFYKMIIAYQLSRYEMLNVKWSDIDFKNNTIKICPVTYTKKDKCIKDVVVVENLARVFPLLPHIKDLLMQEKEKQLTNSFNNQQYNYDYNDYVCLKQDGTRLNANTLSRNLKYIARDNKMPATLISGVKKSCDDFICKRARNYDYYRSWTRFDIVNKGLNIYENLSLLKNKTFVLALNNLIEGSSQSEHRKDFEM